MRDRAQSRTAGRSGGGETRGTGAKYGSSGEDDGWESGELGAWALKVRAQVRQVWRAQVRGGAKVNL